MISASGGLPCFCFLDAWSAVLDCVGHFNSTQSQVEKFRIIKAHPDITLSITASTDLMDKTGDSLSVPASVFREHDVDVAIRFGKGMYPGCRVERLMPAVAVPLCSPELLTRKDKPLVCPADLRFHTLLHDDTPYEGRPDWSSWLKVVGIHDIDSTRGIHFNHVSLALEAAIDCQGVVLSIGQLASNDLAAGKLVIPFETRVPLEYAYHMISLQDSKNAENVDAFRRWLIDEASCEGDPGRLTNGVAEVRDAVQVKS